MAEPIVTQFELWSWVGPRKHVLGGGGHTDATWQMPLNCPCVVDKLNAAACILLTVLCITHSLPFCLLS